MIFAANGERSQGVGELEAFQASFCSSSPRVSVHNDTEHRSSLDLVQHFFHPGTHTKTLLEWSHFSSSNCCISRESQIVTMSSEIANIRHLSTVMTVVTSSLYYGGRGRKRGGGPSPSQLMPQVNVLEIFSRFVQLCDERVARCPVFTKRPLLTCLRRLKTGLKVWTLLPRHKFHSRRTSGPSNFPR